MKVKRRRQFKHENNQGNGPFVSFFLLFNIVLFYLLKKKKLNSGVYLEKLHFKIF